MAPRPPAFLAALLRAATSRDAANAAIGDMIEEFGALTATDRAPAMPRIWFAWRMTGAVVAEISAALPRSLRTALLVVRDAWRSVRRSPAHSVFVMLILALGIAVGTLTFSVVDAVLLKPLPIDHPEELVSILSSNGREKPYRQLTAQQYFDFHDRTQSLSSAAILSGLNGSDATVDGVTEFLDRTYASADLFDVLRLKTQLGRLWTHEDEAAGRLDGVLLSDAFWTRRFNRDVGVLGKAVVVGSRSFRVIGVLSAAASVPGISMTQSPIWMPNLLSRNSPPGSHIGLVIGRMRPGVTPDIVGAELRHITEIDWRPDVAGLAARYTSGARSWMLLALGAAALVVLIACVNAANLLLARSTERSQEIAIRSSIGASRRRVALSVLAEGLLLSSGATAVAVLFSIWGVSAVRSVLTTMVLGLYRAGAIALNGRVLAVATAAAVVTGLLFAVVPAWQMSRASVVNLLKDGGPGITSSGRRWRSGFLVAEMASVCVLVVIAWMFVSSLIKVVTVDLGIDREHQLAVNPRMPFKGTVDEVQRVVRNIPGVNDVALSRGAGLPIFGRISGAWITTDMTVEGGDAPALEVLEYRVTANYFDVANLPLARGSTWAQDTDPTTNAPVILDEVAARQLFGDIDPMGRQVVTTSNLTGVHTVIGIVPHVRAAGPEDEVPPSVYFPLKHDPARVFASLLVRTSGSPKSLVPAVTKALEPFAPNQPEPYIHSADEAMARITTTRRFNAWLMSSFGIAGLLIGAAGIFAVMASLVAQQTREIGVRVALGATPAIIQREVLKSAVRHVAIGLAIGLPLAWWFSQGFAAMLFRVTPTDVSVYTGVALLLALVGLLAAAVPARRASKVDPVVSLRQ